MSNVSSPSRWYTAKSYSDQKKPSEPSLDYLPEFVNQEPALESSDENSSTTLDEIPQMYNQRTANVKANESLPSQKRPREPSLDYLPEFVNQEPALESSDENSSTPSNEIPQMYNQQIANLKANDSSPSQKRPREPSLDYLPEFVNQEPALESSDENSSTPSNEIPQMYNQRIANVKSNESSPRQKRPNEPSLDYLPEFANHEPALESPDDNSSTPSNEILQMYDKRIAYVKANANKSSPTG